MKINIDLSKFGVIAYHWIGTCHTSELGDMDIYEFNSFRIQSEDPQTIIKNLKKHGHNNLVEYYKIPKKIKNEFELPSPDLLANTTSSQNWILVKLPESTDRKNVGMRQLSKYLVSKENL